MFNYFLKSFNKCKNKNDVIHLSKQFLKNIYLFNTYEISLCLNKFSKINFCDQVFWNKVCYIFTATNNKFFENFKSLKKKNDQHKLDERKEENNKQDDNDIKTKITSKNTVEYVNKDSHNGKLINYFNIEELCLILNSLSKVNVKNDEILKTASEKLIKEINLNKHVINMIKAISYFDAIPSAIATASNINVNSNTTTTTSNLESVMHRISKEGLNLNEHLTERDISVLIELTLKKNNQHEQENVCTLSIEKKNNEEIDNKPIEYEKLKNDSIKNVDAFKSKLISSLKKFSYISEQSIALILNAYSRSSKKNKKLLDILKIIIILKLKKENKCSDVFLSSVTHSYSSFVYKDKILFNTLADYTHKNINSIGIKPLVIILNSFININILNIKLFNESLNKLSDEKVILNLSNQCTSNVVTIFTKAHNYLDKNKIRFIFETIIKRIKKNYRLLQKKLKLYIHTKDGTNEEKLESKVEVLNIGVEQRNLFIFNFLTKHLTNILNNFSKLNYIDSDLFQIFTYLILRKKSNINKLDFLNITSSYARSGFINNDMYVLIKTRSREYVINNDLKYIEFINLFNSVSNFYIIEKNEHKKNNNKEVEKKEDHAFKDIINLMIKRLKEDNSIRACVGDNSNGANNHVHTDKSKIVVLKKTAVNHTNNKHTKISYMDDIQCNFSKDDIYNNSSSDTNYNYSSIKNKNILDNLSTNHICSILSSLCKLNIHDKMIYDKCLQNIKNKIFKINGKCFTIYLLYICKYNIIMDKYISTIISNSFKLIYTNTSKVAFQSGRVGEAKNKESYITKLENLYAQLQTNDIINPIYTIRCLIKNDFNYENNNIYIIYQYLLNICKIIHKKTVNIRKEREKGNLSNNIIKIDQAEYEENNISKNRKLNIQSSCVLINSLSFLNTHLYFKDAKYGKTIIFLLIYAFKCIFTKLNYTNINSLLYNIQDDKKKNEIQNVIQKNIDSASIRQLNMSILILFYLNSLNSVYTSKCNLYNYPITLLKYFYFMLTYSPFTKFEKYSSVYNSLSNQQLAYNYDYSFNVNGTHHTNYKMPHTSSSELAIYHIILHVLKKKAKQSIDYSVFSTYNVYMYSIDIIIMAKNCQK